MAFVWQLQGPGAIHLLNGLYDAKLDKAPVLAISGQVENRFTWNGLFPRSKFRKNV
ncbi:thiamine pyrophosphate-binding protein [Bacillus cereus]